MVNGNLTASQVCASQSLVPPAQVCPRPSGAWSVSSCPLPAPSGGSRPSLRVVAQHAFLHLVKHAQETPSSTFCGLACNDGPRCGVRPLSGAHRRRYRQLRPCTDPEREVGRRRRTRLVPWFRRPRGTAGRRKGVDLRHEVKWQSKPIGANAGWKRYFVQVGLQNAGRARGCASGGGGWPLGQVHYAAGRREVIGACGADPSLPVTRSSTS